MPSAHTYVCAITTQDVIIMIAVSNNVTQNGIIVAIGKKEIH
jgi:hypothetical protein